MCCRISAAPKGRSAARTTITAPNGPLSISDLRSRHELHDAFIAGAQEAGFPFNPDFNGAEQEGVGAYQLTVRRMRRCSAAVAYLSPAMKRPNLKVEIHAFAHRVLFDGKRAVGLEFEQNGAIRRVGARREVLFSGGSLLSPQLLQFSGVGPANCCAARHRRRPRVAGGRRQSAGPSRLPGDLQGAQPNTLNEISRSWVRQVQTGLEYVFGRRGALMMGAAPIGLFAKTREGLPRPIAVPVPRRQLRQAGRADAPVPGLLTGRDPVPAGKPRLAADQIARPARAAGDAAELSRRPAATRRR